MEAGEALDVAVRLVRQGGMIARDMIRRVDVHAVKARGDLVTAADLRVEAHILDHLRRLFPDHGFFSEEAGGERTDAPYVWVLDPIDGTKHYVRGNPMYAVSLALTAGGETVAGAVYLPEMEQLYAAARGQGATVNGRPIRCSAEARLAEAIPCVEIPSRHMGGPEQARAFDRLQRLIRHTQRVRIFGVSSIGLCLTAAGSFDVYVNLGSGWQPHDVAAARLILTEAGGRYRAEGQHLIAGPPDLCDQVERVLG
ncbi:MAG: inositol monophosphatase [Rhodothermaceae bacterium]|nr:MAG: inositol monophosphatase [Rhodothermaceae bacterium]